MWFIRALEERFICGMLSAPGVFFVGTSDSWSVFLRAEREQAKLYSSEPSDLFCY